MEQKLDLAQIDKAYCEMHEILCKVIRVSELDVMLEAEQWKRDGKALAIKLAQHLHSARCLANSSGFAYKSGNVEFVDFPSIHVLIRAALETFIVYAYVYKPEDLSLCQFRHNSWALGGLADRQKVPPDDEVQAKQLSEEKRRIEVLETLIRGSPHFKNFENKAKRLFNGDWRAGSSWQKLGIEAGLDVEWIDHVYNHLSGHAHTNYISILQIDQASLEIQRWMASISLSMGLEVMARFVSTYARKFTRVRKYLDENPRESEILDAWKFSKTQN